MNARLLLCTLLVSLLPLLGSPASADEPYTHDELREIVGPIALYPDVVLASLLPASTNPTQVVQAARWVGGQSGEIGEIPSDRGWDASVQAMVQFPDVLVQMSENLEWLEMLAYAVSVQQSEVLQAIQDFRTAAKDAGNLQSNEQVQVVAEGGAIEVAPASPEVVYVQAYDPVAVVQPGYAWGTAAVSFAAGALGAWAWNEIHWGGSGGYGSINVSNSAQFNFTNTGAINRGTAAAGSRWNAATRPAARPAGAAGRRPSAVGAAGRPVARPAGGGIAPGASRPAARPTGARPATRPGDLPGRAGQAPGGVGGPGGPGGGARPQRPEGRPAGAERAGGDRSFMSGSSGSGRAAQQASSRGRSSQASGSARGGGGRSAGGRGGGGGGGRRR